MNRPTVIPVLVYADIPAAHDFLVDAFGFTPGGVDRNGDGVPVHAEVRAGESTIWIHRVTHEHQMDAPKVLPFVHGGMSVMVPDIDAHFARAKAAGATLTSEPTDQPYGLREYGAVDPEGHHWWFAAPLRDSAQMSTADSSAL